MVELYIVIGYLLNRVEAPTFIKVVWWVLMGLRILQTWYKDYIEE